MRSPLLLRRVVGDSMLPQLRDGRVVFASGWKIPKESDIVIVRLDDKEVIKRISRISSASCDLISDNVKGSNYHDVSLERIVAVVL